MTLTAWLCRYVTYAAMCEELRDRNWAKNASSGVWRRAGDTMGFRADNVDELCQEVVDRLACGDGVPQSFVWRSLLNRCPACPDALKKLAALWADLDDCRERGAL